MSELIHQRPLPLQTPETSPFWAGCRRGELLLQRCTNCRRYRFYPRLLCPWCESDCSEWVPARGRGLVYAVTTVHRAPTKALAKECPYTVVLVDLDEGVRMMGSIVGSPPDAVAIGAVVEVVFDPVTPEIVLPKFRLVQQQIQSKEETEDG
jgi:uncharacterized OB-fold protein